MSLSNSENFYSEAFARNKGLISGEDQAKLRKARVAIVGLGGCGGIYVTTMARLGIGRLSIADNDVFETVNINRQAGAFVSTAGQKKVGVMEKEAKDINPHIEIKAFNGNIDSNNAAEFLKDVDVVLDGIDFFNVETRLMLFREARNLRIPVVSCAPIGFGAALHTFTHTSMSFKDYFDIKDDQSEQEKVLQFGLGLSPSLVHRSYYPPNLINLKNKIAPSSVVSVILCANLAATQVFKIVTGRKYISAPTSLQFDPMVQEVRKTYLWKGNRNPIQLLKKWYIRKKVGL